VVWEHVNKVLVTGAAGFLGSHLIRALSDRGIAVRAFVWERADLRALECLDIDVFRGDVTRSEHCLAAVQGVDMVIHAAAMVSFQPGDRKAQTAVNVGGTRNMLEAARQAGVGRFVHISTVNAFGFPRPGEIGDEGTVFNWTPFDIGYMETKKHAQDLVLAAAGEGFDAVVCNPGTMFGPFDVNMNAASYIQALARARGVMFCPPGGTNIADVRAVARGVLLAAEKGRAGKCYILGGLNVSYETLFRGILRLLNRYVPVVTLPASAVVAAARVCERVCGGLGQRPPLTLEMAHGAVHRLFYTSQRAVTELGYDPGDPWQAILETIHWLGWNGRSFAPSQ